LAALIDVLENDPEKTAQTSLGSSFSGLLPDEADFPTYVKNVDALEAKVIALKEEFDLSNGRISILKQIVVSAGPKFLMSSAKVEISKLVNDDWRKVMVWAGMNGGAETGLRLTAYPIVSGSEYNSEAPLEFTDHGVAVLKRLHDTTFRNIKIGSISDLGFSLISAHPADAAVHDALALTHQHLHRCFLALDP